MSVPFRKNGPITKALNSTAIDLPVARNITVFWNLGFLLSVTLIVQIITGFLLSTHYTPRVELALESVNSHIVRDVNSG